MQVKKYKKNINIKKYKKGTLQNLKIKFYYRPDWWKYRYVRWVSVGKRKSISRKKKYSIFWAYKKTHSGTKILFNYRTLKHRKEKKLVSTLVRTRFFSEVVDKEVVTLEKLVAKFYCVLNSEQARFIIKKGWVLINGKPNKNPKLRLQKADIATLTPIVWNRLATWFHRFHKKRKKIKVGYNQKGYKSRKLKIRRKQRLKLYKSFKTFVLFRKINSIGFIHNS